MNANGALFENAHGGSSLPGLLRKHARRGSHFGEVVKTLRHPQAGLISLDYSAFLVEGRPDLNLVVYTPATAQDALLVNTLLAGHQP